MAVIISKMTDSLTADVVTLTGFQDDGDIPAWAKQAVERLRKRGVVQGRGSNQFNPLAAVTRAEAITVLLKFIAGDREK